MRRLARLLADLAVPLLWIGGLVGVFRFGVLGWLERSLGLGESSSTVLRRAGVTAMLLLGYWAAARFYERRRLSELAFRPRALLAAAAAGVAMVVVTLVVVGVAGGYQVHAFRGFDAALPVMVTICLAVVFEEVVFRGVIFRILARSTGTLVALALQSLVFASLHLFNTGSSVMTLLSVTLLGALWAALFAVSRNLWVSVAHHAAWNLTIFASGLPLSGQEAWRELAPLETTYRGPAWWTGGGFGPEDSVVSIVVVAGVLVWLLRRSRVDGERPGVSGPAAGSQS